MKIFKKYKYEWLIIFLVHDFGGDEFKRIIDCNIGEFTDEGIDNRNAVIKIHTVLMDTNGNEKLFKTFLQELLPVNEKYDFINTKELEKFNFTDSSTWHRAFNEIINLYDPEKIIFITLSHGAGFGIYGQDLKGLDFKRSLNKYYSKNFMQENFPALLRSFVTTDKRSFFHDRGNTIEIVENEQDPICKALELLWVSELNDALKQGFGKRKVDILMMCNCYMQTYDTGWILREQVDYLVAPETLFGAYGYSFTGLLKNIKEKPGIQAKELVRTFKTDFINKWKSIEIGETELSRVSVTIVNLKLYWLSKRVFDQISILLEKLSEDKIEKIILSRQQKINNVTTDPIEKSGDTGLVELVDLGYLMREIANIFSSNLLLRLLISFFQKLKKESSVDCYIGDAFIKHDQDMSEPKKLKYRLSGVSILFPYNIETTNKAKISNCAFFGKPQIEFNSDNIPSYEFTNTTKWDEFLQKVISVLKKRQL